jgi:N-succinyldiaminopimelate aminotransferase
VTCGVTEAVIAAMLGIVNPGEKVVVLEPAHENYHARIAFAGGIPIWIPLRPPHYQFDPEELALAFEQKPKAVLFNSPHNSSGRVFTEKELSIIRDLCVKHDVLRLPMKSTSTSCLTVFAIFRSRRFPACTIARSPSAA